MSEKQHPLKFPNFIVVLKSALEFDKDETVDGERVLNALKLKSNRAHSGFSSNPVRITLLENCAVASRPIWWANSKETRLPYAQIRALYAFEKQAKKLCVDVASPETQKSRVLVLKLKDAVERVKLLEALEKFKMLTSMYDEKNVRPVQFGHWSSGYYVEENNEGDVNKPETSQPARQSELGETLSRENRSVTLPRTPIPKEPVSTRETTQIIHQAVETDRVPAAPTNIHIIFQGVDPSSFVASDEMREGNERYITLTPIGFSQSYGQNGRTECRSAGIPVGQGMPTAYQQQVDHPMYPNEYDAPFPGGYVSGYEDQPNMEQQMYAQKLMAERMRGDGPTDQMFLAQPGSYRNHKQSHYVTLWKQHIDSTAISGFPSRIHEMDSTEQSDHRGLDNANYSISPRKSKTENIHASNTNTEMYFYRLKSSTPGVPDEQGSRYAFVSKEDSGQ
ncbi:hypothetical protein T265_10100 [Opisthorchis viverrini]|uniref:Uncharacterized protein n=1 Tax=Opisthorchis viverrini TaxID=6198 RepID=A0A074ZEF9_OPIVI|nr:hypothetical protein T265_10100 [Opisthorchis viverrini]KER21605.1 hypothetical protein T265_10100 [Opisthorchis viverrini]